MRKIKTLHVCKTGGQNEESFEISFNKTSAPEYLDEIDVRDEVEAGIIHEGLFYEKAIEHFRIEINENEINIENIDILKYTKMVKMRNVFTNISVIVPLMTGNNNEWKTGSLFTTFPLIEHLSRCNCYR